MKREEAFEYLESLFDGRHICVSELQEAIGTLKAGISASDDVGTAGRDLAATTHLTGVKPMTAALDLITQERHRQVTVEGWGYLHDDEHTDNALSKAASCYALAASKPCHGLKIAPSFWPWAGHWWKPSPEPLRNLAKAGALILAEIERIHRAQKTDAKEAPAATTEVLSTTDSAPEDVVTQLCKCLKCSFMGEITYVKSIGWTCPKCERQYSATHQQEGSENQTGEASS